MTHLFTFVLLQLSFQVAPPAPAAAPVAAAAVPVVVDDSKEGREKRAKNISKKLKAIQEIRAKQAAGQPLEPEQVCGDTFAKTNLLWCFILCVRAHVVIEVLTSYGLYIVYLQYLFVILIFLQKLKLDSEAELLAELKSLTV